MENYEDKFKSISDAELKELILCSEIIQKLEPIYETFYALQNKENTLEIMNSAIDKYNTLSEGKNKEFISCWINIINRNFINYNILEENMVKKDNSRDIEKIYDWAINFGRGVIKTVNKTKFIDDVVDACHSEDIGLKEKETMTKIFDYHTFAQYAKDKYNDSETYNSLRRKCIYAYKSIISEECKKVILEYVDKEFLKAK
jgi:hypothetical protein